MLVCVYIDGFNLYYRCLRGTPYKWLNVAGLAKRLLPNDAEVIAIRYFTADVSPRSGDEDAPIRQATYLRALKTIPELTIHKGRFMPKKVTRPLVNDPSKFVEVHDTEEKGSDVNLASHLLMDAFSDRFHEALVISQDTDLLEPLRMVAEELGKPVRIAWSEASSPGKKHKQIVTEIHRIRRSDLAVSQFGPYVIAHGGHRIEKPSSW